MYKFQSQSSRSRSFHDLRFISSSSSSSTTTTIIIIIMSFLLLLLLMVNICLGATNPYKNNADYFNPIIHDHQIQIANNFLFNHVQSLMINNYRKYYQILFNNNVNTSSYVKTINDQNCLQLLKQTLIHPLETEWSAKLIDSTGSIFGHGLLSGTFTSFGDFDSCISIDTTSHHHHHHHLSSKNDDDDISFIGKYCIATLQYLKIDANINDTWKQSLLERWLQANVRYPIANGICLPSVCETKFVGNIIQDAFQPLRDTNFNIEFCQTKQDSSFNDWFLTKYILTTTIIILFALIILATILEIYGVQMDDNGTKSLQMISCFSLCTNFRSLFVIKKRMQYPWIDGWRVLLTLIVLISHVSINQGVLHLSPLSPFIHFPDDYLRQMKHISNRYLVNSTWTIKSFFMMSGFLLAQSFLKSKNSPSFGRYVLVRWLRFTPCYLGYIILTLLLGFTGAGPLFHEKIIEPYLKPCVNNLAYHLLYINNWLDFRQMCGFQTWYISVDFQLYLLSFIVLALHYHNFNRLAYMITFLFIISSYIMTMVMFIWKIHGIPFFISPLYPQLPLADRGYFFYWTATYNHFEAYFTGITIGVMVNKKIIFNMSKVLIRNLFLFSQAMLAIVPHIFPLFYVDYQQERQLLDLISSYSWSDALIITIPNILWLISLSFMFYLLSTYPTIMKENIIIKTLSSHFFVPLARISFAIYLVHVPLTWFIVHHTRFPQLRNEFGTFTFCFLLIIISVLAAIIIHIFFELPFTKLIHLLLYPKSSTTTTKQQQQQ
ncbi:acyltransferase-like protein 2 [Dermatophagoides farinae]|uniref:Acyltransferase-like protein 2 n=1 Tax=Dermatophagoides farinae TaxID=6954 RepID=A0A9D4NUD9_DERFA|nr:acyltransferase-like protein 2 [Dermatophagoides farinae]